MGRKPKMLMVFLVIATAVMSFSCDDTGSPAVIQPRTGIESSLTLNPERISSDSKLEIIYEVKNHGPDTLSLGFYTGIHFGFNVETPDGDAIYYPARYMDSYPTKLELLPGESRKYSFTLGCQASANDGSYWPSHLDRLPVGKHKIAGGLIGHKENCPWPEKEFYVIE